MNVGTQLVALSVVLVVAAQYFQYRRLKLVSTKMFECFLALSVFCMLSDVFCAYSLYHPQYFSMEMVRVFHQFFLGSLNFLIYYVYIYIDVRGRRGMSYTPSQFICRSLPLIIATFFILFAPLEYHVGDDGCYSYGAMVDAVFALCFIYMLLVIITILRDRKSINEVSRIDFWFSFAIWIMIASYQFFVPNANLISLALALIVLFIFIAFENSKENADKDVPCILSRHSFENSLEELFGEQKVIATGCKHMIIRTAWLYSEFGKNFVKTMMSLTATKPQLKVVFDQVGTPTYAYDLAAAILDIIENRKYEGNTGVYHYSNEGVCSWFDFTKIIAEIAGNTECDIKPCHSDEFPSPVKRPAYSVLDKTKVKETFGIIVPYWTDSLKKCMNNLMK